VITTDEHLLLLRNGERVLDLDPAEMFALRDAIDDGARHLREGLACAK
jgi:hypothetical protein